MIEFVNNKIYLNSELNINDLVKIVGTNRSYISAVINEESNQNFCSFVNSFRMEAMEQIIIEDSGLNHEELAQRCGFGSVNSLKRSVYSKSGLSLKDFKQQIILSHQKNMEMAKQAITVA